MLLDLQGCFMMQLVKETVLQSMQCCAGKYTSNMRCYMSVLHHVTHSAFDSVPMLTFHQDTTHIRSYLSRLL